MHYGLNYDRRCSQSKQSSGTKHNLCSVKNPQNQKVEKNSKKRYWDITHMACSQALASDLKKKKNKNHGSEPDID